MAQEVKQKQPEGDFIKYDLDNLQVWAGDYELKLNPNGHLPEVSDKILEYIEEFETLMKNNPSATEKIRKNRETTKEILSIGLTDFDYVDASEKLGYGILDKVANFLFSYHVEHGGKEGFKLWLAQLNLAMKIPSNGTED
jgi:hypothetical protein